MQFGTLVNAGLPSADPAVPAARAAHDRWPLPALAAWALAWGGFWLLRAAGLPDAFAMAGASAVGGALGIALRWLGATRWRSLIVAGGFPLSLWASGLAGALPAWSWLLPLALLALAYPLSAWRDAPFFPTPAEALDGLATVAPLPRGARVLDAGCGLGHGLGALRRAYPAARLSGVEFSRPLALLARLRCRLHSVRAEVRRGDMWAADWRGQDLVYLFQRPESLPRAVAKARSELSPGAWLASLEFEAAELQPQAVLDAAGRRLWLYRVPFAPAAGSAPTPPEAQRRPRR